LINNTRRDFLKKAGLAGALCSAKNIFANTPSKNMPISISTWDSGIKVNEAAWQKLATNKTALDAVEAGGNSIELLQDCCVGLNGYPDRDGIVTLDASIMDHNFNCGSVAALQGVTHPISVARKIMETTPHVMLAGTGAQQFAAANGFTVQPNKLSVAAQKAYTNWLQHNQYKPIINIENKKQNGPFAPLQFDDGTYNHDTMGTICLDAFGNLAAGITTSGMAFKMHGRVGDSPIIGAGMYVDNEVGAVVSSGLGEEVIKNCGAFLTVEFMRNGLTPEQACKKTIERIVKRAGKRAKEFQIGFVAINNKGQYGAFAIQKKFAYAVKTNTLNKLFTSKYLI
jgi:N4-(beta-N-acetylglucosaminyl)-L-asparaginase